MDEREEGTGTGKLLAALKKRELPHAQNTPNEHPVVAAGKGPCIQVPPA